MSFERQTRMSRIWGMVDVGKRSMMNSQTALQTVSHNVANKNTEGFSRQRVDLQTTEPTGFGKLRIGNGARATSVTRINNNYIEKQLEHEGNVLGNKDSKAQMLTRVEQVFNEQMNKGLNKYMGEFFNAFREMSNSPENVAIRNQVKEAGDFLAKDFQRVHKQLTGIQGEADFQITTEVSAINAITREISQLNDKIASVEINAVSANDERDRRDQLIKDLSGKANIKYGESTDGILTITMGNTGILVSGGSQRDIFVSSSPDHDGKKEGNVDIFYKPTESGAAVNMTNQIKGGSLGGLLEIRDQFVNETLGQLDELATSLSQNVNAAHREGYDRYDRKGVDFFQHEAGKSTSETLQVNTNIMEDPNRVVSAAQVGSPGDNRVANVISALQYRPVMSNKQSTFDDFYGGMVGKVGISANKANSEFESQKNIVGQLKNIRESISGVSLDEEAAKMIEYQKSFEASARLIRTADQMLETVLQLKPM